MGAGRRSSKKKKRRRRSSKSKKKKQEEEEEEGEEDKEEEEECTVFVTPVPHPHKVAQGAQLIKIHVSWPYLQKCTHYISASPMTPIEPNLTSNQETTHLVTGQLKVLAEKSS